MTTYYICFFYTCNHLSLLQRLHVLYYKFPLIMGMGFTTTIKLTYNLYNNKKLAYN